MASPKKNGPEAAKTAEGVDGRSSSVRREALDQLRKLLHDDLAAVITILAATSYGYLRLLQVSFYRQIGVSPEDVGLGYAQTLSKGFATVLILAVYFVALVGAAILGIGVGDWAAKKAAKRLRSWLKPVGAGAIILICMFLAALIEQRSGLPVTSSDVLSYQIQDLAQVDVQTSAMALAVTVVALGAGVAIGWASSAAWPPKQDESAPGEQENEPTGSSKAPVYWIVGGVTSFVVLAGGLSMAGSMGQRVASGQSLPADSIVSSFVGLQASEVEIECCAKHPRLHVPRRALFLGSSDGTAVLYAAGQVWRVPLDQIVLHSPPRPGASP